MQRFAASKLSHVPSLLKKVWSLQPGLNRRRFDANLVCILVHLAQFLRSSPRSVPALDREWLPIDLSDQCFFYRTPRISRSRRQCTCRDDIDMPVVRFPWDRRASCSSDTSGILFFSRSGCLELEPARSHPVYSSRFDFAPWDASLHRCVGMHHSIVVSTASSSVVSSVWFALVFHSWMAVSLSSPASTPAILVQTKHRSCAFPLDRRPQTDKKKKRKVSSGDGAAGYRSLYLSHAKRALYHLSYSPMDRRVTGFPVARLYVTPSHVARGGVPLFLTFDVGSEDLQTSDHDASGARDADATMRVQARLLNRTMGQARGTEGEEDAYNVPVSDAGSAMASFSRRNSRCSRRSLGNKRTSFPIVPASPCWPDCDAGIQGSGSL